MFNPDGPKIDPRHIHRACAICRTKLGMEGPGVDPDLAPSPTLPQDRAPECCWCGRHSESLIFFVDARSCTKGGPMCCGMHPGRWMGPPPFGGYPIAVLEELDRLFPGDKDGKT